MHSTLLFKTNAACVLQVILAQKLLVAGKSHGKKENMKCDVNSTNFRNETC